MNTRKIRGWVIKWHEVGAVKGIFSIAWDNGHSVERNTRNQQRSDTESHQEEREESIFPQAIQKNCDTDTPAIPVKPEPQTIKCEPPG